MSHGSLVLPLAAAPTAGRMAIEQLVVDGGTVIAVATTSGLDDVRGVAGAAPVMIATHP